MKPIEERAIKVTETTIADLKKYIEDMDAYIEVSKRLLEIDRQKLQESEAKIAQLEADIAAARLQAWYRDNPGIELAVGDQLAVTDEFRENRRLYGGLWLYEASGVVIESIYPNFEGGMWVRINPNDPGTSCGIPIDTARRMRQAWLAQEAKS